MPGTPELAVDGTVATITLQRPDQANRLGPDDLATLYQHVDAVNAMPQVLVLRLQSHGRYFCSGYDIGRIGGERSIDFGTMVDALELARPVTIAVIHGGVYGGATDMALACDFRVGVTSGDMFMPAARLGLHYYPSGMERYVARMGLNAALRLFLTAERIDAAEMKAIGYLTHLVAPDALSAAVDSLTATLAGMAPLALLGMKKNLNRIARGTVDAAEMQRDITAATQSADLQEGRSAWAEKRRPVFTGR
ncbi:MAG: enoyl-CoA hydratase/isomerase family protein [Pseudomonadota bacterium]